MKSFQNILCFVDAAAPSQAALDRAAELAERDGADLKIVDVMDDTPTELGMALRSYTQIFQQHRHEQLQMLAESVRSRAPTVTFELLHGRPALAVVGEVLHNGFDLLLKDARGTSGHKTLLLGSVDMRLLRHCPCPVWLNVPRHGRTHDVILAAIDPAPHDAEHRNMNQTILELASSLAEIEDAELHVVGAWDAEGESLLGQRVSQRQLAKYVAQHRCAAEQGLDRALELADRRIDERHVHLRRGEPAEVILSCASKTKCDLLVMGTVARGIPGLLMGNTADSVLRQVECSVMTVKPSSFQPLPWGGTRVSSQCKL